MHIRVENFNDKKIIENNYLLFIIDKNIVPNFKKSEELFIAHEHLKTLIKQLGGSIDFGLIKGEDVYIKITYNKNIFEYSESSDKKENTDIHEKKYKLLLAEDDKINQKIYTMSLEKYFAKIDIALDSEEVIKK